MKLAGIFILITMAIFVVSVSVVAGNPTSQGSGGVRNFITDCVADLECGHNRRCLHNRCTDAIGRRYA